MKKDTVRSFKGATSSKTETGYELKVATESVVGRFVMVLESRVVSTDFRFLKRIVCFIGVEGRGISGSQDRKSVV